MGSLLLNGDSGWGPSSPLLFTESETPPTPCPSQPDQLTQLPRKSILSGWNSKSDLAHWVSSCNVRVDPWDLVERDPEHLHFHQPPGVFLPPCGDRTRLRFLPSPGRLPGGADLQERGDEREDQAAELGLQNKRSVGESGSEVVWGPGLGVGQGGRHRQAREADPSRAAGQACPAHGPQGG